jgi:hypothetical protein
MERERLAVSKRVGTWGTVYIIGGTEADGEILPAEQADDLIARFDHEQALLGGGITRKHTPRDRTASAIASPTVRQVKSSGRWRSCGSRPCTGEKCRPARARAVRWLTVSVRILRTAYRIYPVLSSRFPYCVLRAIPSGYQSEGSSELAVSSCQKIQP